MLWDTLNLWLFFLSPLPSLGWVSPRISILPIAHCVSAIPRVIKSTRQQYRYVMSTRLQTAGTGREKCTALNMKPEVSKFPQSYNL